MAFINALKLAFEGETYGLGLQANSVTGGFFSVISENIGVVLTLMGVMLGVTWILKRFRKARKGSL